MTHKVARNTREILNKQEAISVLLEISQCFMAQMTGITAGFHMSLDIYYARKKLPDPLSFIRFIRKPA